MEFNYQDLKQYGGIYPLIRHFRHFFWLHPKIAWTSPTLKSRLYPCLDYAVAEGLIEPCKIKPWFTVTPVFLDRLCSRTLRKTQWEMLREGPPAHVSMIHRVAYSLSNLPSDFSVEIDEGVTERSPPPAWGTLSQRVPDILVKAPTAYYPSLWIECERSFKKREEYEKKIHDIGRQVNILYVTTRENEAIRLLNRMPIHPGRQKRLQVMNEIGAMAWLRVYCLYVGQLSRQPQEQLRLGWR